MNSTPNHLSFSRDPDGAFVLEASQWVQAPLDVVFDFFSHPANLEALTPAHLRFQILTPGPLEMRQGQIIDYRISLRGLPMRWRTRISEYEPPHRFADVQERGPYRLWDHRHTFQEENGGTRLGDRVRYRLPLNINLLHPFIRADLRRIFAFRMRVIREKFGG